DCFLSVVLAAEFAAPGLAEPADPLPDPRLSWLRERLRFLPPRPPRRRRRWGFLALLDELLPLGLLPPGPLLSWGLVPWLAPDCDCSAAGCAEPCGVSEGWPC